MSASLKASAMELHLVKEPPDFSAFFLAISSISGMIS